MTSDARTGNWVVRRVKPSEAGEIAPLFDAYRQFYERPADLDAARDFLTARLSQDESIVFATWTAEGRAVAFTQLYPTFGSLQPGRVLILNDLYVHPEYRGRGAARALLQRAREYGLSADAIRLELSTARTNTTAQKLYASLGWIRDDEFLHYELPLV